VSGIYRMTVLGNPIPWERARSRGAQHFTSPRSRAHKARIQVHAKQAKLPRLTGPLRLSATFYRESAQACDVDNLAKAVQDALNGIAYEDDRQIVHLTAVKALDRVNPRTEIVIGLACDPAWSTDCGDVDCDAHPVNRAEGA
jgi:Holliday junction resolvase RusA-like endonuclease